MRNLSIAFFGFSVLAIACGAPQKPATFVTSAKLEGGLDVVSRTLASEGHGTPRIDRQAGIVHGEWKDTGFLYGQVGPTPASIVRRFTVILAPTANGSNVTVRIDTKRCAQGSTVIEYGEVRGLCEDLAEIPAQFQQDVDYLGSKVQAALAAPGN